MRDYQDNKLIELFTKEKKGCYIFDSKALDFRIKFFKKNFLSKFLNIKQYYPIKINDYNEVLKLMLIHNFGLEVASIREVKIAESLEANDILFYKPGKSKEEISYCINKPNIHLHLDSFHELKILKSILSRTDKKVKIGLRVSSRLLGDWSKYGVDTNELIDFYNLLKDCPNINLVGIHFHTSRNKDIKNYELMLKLIGKVANEIKELKYIDFGGGLEQNGVEGYILKDGSKVNYKALKCLELSNYANSISGYVSKYIPKKISLKSEVGRYLVNDCFHVLLKVVDIKPNNNLILNGGVNIVGWPRFLSEYFPVVNLTNPSYKEQRANLWGNLCTTLDIWGYYCYANKFEINDLILVKNQGTLTYSQSQNFINGPTKVLNI